MLQVGTNSIKKLQHGVGAEGQHPESKQIADSYGPLKGGCLTPYHPPVLSAVTMYQGGGARYLQAEPGPPHALEGPGKMHRGWASRLSLQILSKQGLDAPFCYLSIAQSAIPYVPPPVRY